MKLALGLVWLLVCCCLNCISLKWKEQPQGVAQEWSRRLGPARPILLDI